MFDFSINLFWQDKDIVGKMYADWSLADCTFKPFEISVSHGIEFEDFGEGAVSYFKKSFFGSGRLVALISHATIWLSRFAINNFSKQKLSLSVPRALPTIAAVLLLWSG